MEPEVGLGWMVPVQKNNTTRDLYKGVAKKDEYIKLMYFMNPREATAFAKCIAKCRRYNLPRLERKFMLIAEARCAVRGFVAKLAVQSDAKLLVADFFATDGKKGKPEVIRQDVRSYNGNHPPESNV